MPATTFRFWFSETRGIIRQRREPSGLLHPEIWDGRRWVTGSPYVMDAITGMGEDAWSCGELAEKWSPAQAERYAADHGIDLYFQEG